MSDELDKQNERLILAKEEVEMLKEQLARAMTDNTVLEETNIKLRDENEKVLKASQEFGDLNHLLTNKVQRLEQDLVALGQQRDQYKEGFEKYGRKIEELMDRLNRQKLLDKEPVTVLKNA